MTNRVPLMAGNWKMNLNHLEAIALVQKVAFALPDKYFAKVDVAVIPPFTDIRSVQTLIEADQLALLLGAQHCHFEEKGAFTGEVSPAFLAKLDVKLVITGHSERRELFGETDQIVNSKVKSILKYGMTPILCVGETLAEREAGETEGKVLTQVGAGLNGVKADQVAGLVARRISCMPEKGEKVEAGQRIGLIRFGSLLECYMPQGFEAVVSRGEKVFAGETVIGRKNP